MAQFSKFNFRYASKLNFNGGQFSKEISNFGYFKKQIKIGEQFNICDKNVKFKVKNFEHLHSNTRVNFKTIKRKIDDRQKDRQIDILTVQKSIAKRTVDRT